MRRLHHPRALLRVEIADRPTGREIRHRQARPRRGRVVDWALVDACRSAMALACALRERGQRVATVRAIRTPAGWMPRVWEDRV